MKSLLIALALGAAFAAIFWFFFAPHLSYGVYSYTIPGEIPKEPWYSEEFSPAGKVLLTAFVGIGSAVAFLIVTLVFSKKR